MLRGIHSSYLSTPPLSEAAQAVQCEAISDHELIEETRRASRVNPYLGLLADLYEAYLSDAGLIHEQVERGAIVPMASSKIYELWVLAKVVEHLKRSGRSRIAAKKYRDLYVELQLDGLQLAYDEPQPDPFVGGLARSRLRPDFLFESRGGVAVYDAKYKEELSRDDVVELLAYIAEFATPIELRGRRVPRRLLQAEKRQGQAGGEERATAQDSRACARGGSKDERRGDRVEREELPAGLDRWLS